MNTLKKDIKDKLRQLLLSSSPENLHQATDKLIISGLKYAQGYNDALLEFAEKPYTKRDIQTFVIEQTAKYLYKIIIDDKNS